MTISPHPTLYETVLISRFLIKKYVAHSALINVVVLILLLHDYPESFQLLLR